MIVIHKMIYSEFFDKRKNTFEKAYEHILANINNNNVEKPYIIVELGTSRSFVTGTLEGCCDPNIRFWQPGNPKAWDWGAGIFTKVFSDNLCGLNYLLYTIDPSENAVRIAKTICGDNKKVNIMQTYSTNFLNTLPQKIDFLYMDHMESSEEACLQHLRDAKLIVEKDSISENGCILIDDVGDNITHTKGKYSIPYLLENGYTKVLHEYQVLLVRTNKKEHIQCKIPKHIYQTFVTNEFSPQFQYIIDSWKRFNPDYTYSFFTDNDCAKFIKDNFDSRVYNAYRRILPGAFKADLWRYCVLYVNGGIYADIDTLCMGKIDDFLTKDVEFAVPIDLFSMDETMHHNLFNTFIASVPKSPILKNSIDRIVRHVETNTIPESRTDFSGPGVLGRAVNTYLGLDETTSFVGKEGIHNTIHFLYFETRTEYVKDLDNRILLQNKNGNPQIQCLYHMLTQKAKTICWVNSPKVLLDE